MKALSYKNFTTFIAHVSPLLYDKRVTPLSLTAVTENAKSVM